MDITRIINGVYKMNIAWIPTISSVLVIIGILAGGLAWLTSTRHYTKKECDDKLDKLTPKSLCEDRKGSCGSNFDRLEQGQRDIHSAMEKLSDTITKVLLEIKR